MDFISSFFTKALIYTVVIPVLIVVFFLFRRSAKQKKAARIAADQQRRRQEEVKKQIEIQQFNFAKMQEEAEKIRRQHLAEIDAAVAQCPGSEKYRLETQQTEVTVPDLNITQFTPISKKRYIAFDFETTGLRHNADNIVEIGAVRVENGEITAEFHQLVDPECPMPAEASAVNHITDSMLAGQPKIHQVLPAFLSFVGDDVIVAHNAAFDVRFLSQACMRNRFRVPGPYFDTMLLARYWPEAESKKLSSLLAAAGIENDEAHRALGDARAVTKLISATNERRQEKKTAKKAPQTEEVS